MLKFLYMIANVIRRLVQRCLNMSTVGVKALIINHNQEVLLIKHTYMNGWHLPGGGLNPGETPLQAVIREVQEEAAIQAKSPPELFAVYTHKILGANDYPILYVIRHFEALTQTPDPREIQAAQWFAIDALPLDTTESTRKRIDEILNRSPIDPTW